jgi:phytoene synthase
MSNFIRDVARTCAAAGSTYRRKTSTLSASLPVRPRTGSGHPPMRELLRFEIARTRAIYRAAAPGIDLLHPSSRDCISDRAFLLYRGNPLDEVEGKPTTRGCADASACRQGPGWP